MARKKYPTTREVRKTAYTTGTEKKQGLKPIPDSMRGPAKGKGGVGRPRTGNLATVMDPHTGTELGASHAHLDHAYNRFLEGISEPDLHQALAVDPKKKYQQALLMLTHPAYTRALRRGSGKPGEWSITAVLKKVGVTLPELMEVYGRYRTSQAVRIAMDRSPTIISHTADDAENRSVPCPRCDGFGTLDLDFSEEESSKKRKASVRTCPECDGTGKVIKSGDNEARKLVLEVAGIAGKKGPMVDARSIHMNGQGSYSVESMIKGMEEAEDADTARPLLAEGEITDAEIIE